MNRNPMRVLIVEDDADIAALLEVMLSEQDDMTVRTWTNDFASLLTAEIWNDVDAVVMDIMLPGVAGTTILEHVKDTYPHVRRIVLSAIDPDFPCDFCGLECKLPGDARCNLAAHVRLLKPQASRSVISALRGVDDGLPT